MIRALCGKVKQKHVGNVVSSSLTDECDIMVKKQDFFHQVNKLLCEYQGVRHDILTELFSKYCTSYYGSQAWDLRSQHVATFHTAWNKAARRVLKLPFNSHRYFLHALLNVEPIQIVLQKRFLKLCMTMEKSKNDIVSYCYRFF